MIPKIIYGAWFGNELPEQFKKYVDSWSKIMPDYEIKMIGNDNIKLDDVVTESLARKKYCVTSNYIRIKQLYETGGIYLDTDIEVVKSFDSLLHNSFVIGIEDRFVCNGAVILSEPKHPFLKQCLDALEKINYNDKDIDLTTGPRLMTSIAKKYGWDFWKIGKFDDIAILPPEYFYPYHYTEKYTPECVKENTYTVHHWSMSWSDKVSVVIPCYNQGHFLKDAIDSALNSTHKHLEVIVVNDGSTDETEKVALSYGNRIRYIKQENKGLSAARNTGIKNAYGAYIVTLDSDDKIHPSFISKALGKADIVCAKLQCFGKSNAIWQSPKKYPTYKDLLQRNQLFSCSIFKKEVWLNIDGYDEQMFVRGKQGCNGYEDWDFWIRAAKHGYTFMNLDDVLIYYRKHDSSMFTDALKNHKQIMEYMASKYPVNKNQKY